MVYVVGVGPGNKEYILPKAIDILETSDIIIGFKRIISDLDFISRKKVITNSLKDTLEFININGNMLNEKGKESIISVVASGDPTFFGISEYIRKNYTGNMKIIPGLSSFQYLTCKVNKSWSNGYCGSVHGREDDFIKKVNENKLSIWLTDNKNNCSSLCKKLQEDNIDCNVIIGEYLSYENERILEGKPVEFINEDFSDMSIIVVERNY